MELLGTLFNKLLSFFLLTIILYSNIFLVSYIYNNNTDYQKYKYTINKSKINDDQTCKLFQCTAIRKGDVIKYYDKNVFIDKENKPYNNIHIGGRYFFDLYDFGLNYKLKNNLYIYEKVTKESYFYIFIYSLPLFFLIMTFIIVQGVIKSYEIQKVRMIENSELNISNTSSMITENIHHELSTPLTVINSKILKIKEKTQKSNPNFMEEDFKYINISMSQIQSILSKMKKIKQIKQDDTPKDLYEIFTNMFIMLSVSFNNFEYKISEELKNIYIDSKVLTACDLVSIGLNHTKNSLEGKASKIFIVFEKIENNYIHLRIVDNGTGIPKKYQKNIFKPNFSTKSKSTGPRGNGMYLNKQIMKNAGGDIKLISSSNKGTAIGLIFKVKQGDNNDN